jgi:outer membrane immunogenic protein
MRFNNTETFTAPGISFFGSSLTFANEFGWVVGAGLEWKFIDHWLLRGEWLHYDFGRDTVLDLEGLSPLNARTSVDIARAALSYKL